MKRKVLWWVVVIFLGSGSVLFAQSPKKYYKTGKEFLAKNAYQDAIEQFSKAIELKPEFTDAYIARAEVYETLGEKEKALEDYRRTLVFLTKDGMIYYHAGKLCYDLGKYEDAVELLDKAIGVMKKPLAPYTTKIHALMALEEYDKALDAANKLLNLKKDATNYFLRGKAYEALKNTKAAENDYLMAERLNSRFIEPRLALAGIYLQEDKPEQAMRECNTTLSLDSKNTRAYLLRSKIYVKQLDMPNAINDISRILLIEPDNADMFFLRGTYYQMFNQHINAITDFTKAISLRPDDPEVYMARAKSYEEILDYKSAEKDYQKITTLSKDNLQAQKLLEQARQRLYELNRESDPPVITLQVPQPVNKKFLNIPENKEEVVLKGVVKDQSNIEYLNINGRKAHLDKKEGVCEFLVSVPVRDTDLIVIEASDIYHNKALARYTLKKTEVNPPMIQILAPYASDNGEIYLETQEPQLYIEGKVMDESPIKTVMINGVYASFDPEEHNPHFTASIDIVNKNQFTVTAEDIYGNKKTQNFKLNREGIALYKDNPMGKTWAVFIENANYQTFASLDGPPKDITLMKNALARYKVSNIIVKKDMTKAEMEKFFSIELRDLVRSNHVNSILIWYAGHGKFINETGYWIPVDAKRDDEFTYFNINNLKASLQGYSKYVTHTLVVTDACESGPTFYQAMRAIPEQRSCDDWKATKFKSSQVFSSAGYELATDDSQFTRTFANTLLNNPDACIPIESIVQKVTKAVVSARQQKPQFGKIAGLEDENGTFFFISK